MNFINKLERRYGRYAIKNLMKYVVILYVIGLFISMMPYQVYGYLRLDFTKIFKGQIWRLVTFVIPMVDVGYFLLKIISVYVYYIIGNALENAWGSFRLNLYFFAGLLFNVIGAFITYLLTGITVWVSVDSISPTLFFALAAMYPDMRFFLYFLIPIKAKYLAWFQGIMYMLSVFGVIKEAIRIQTPILILHIVPIIISMANFLIFFLIIKNGRRLSPREIRRRTSYHRKVKEGQRYGHKTQYGEKTVITRHKCAVCGKTELDDDDLEFRFCSKCDGNYEYCMEHLFTHEHVKK